MDVAAFLFSAGSEGTNMNPFQSLLLSRKFWLLILDTVVSLVLYFGTKYLTPMALDDVKILIITLQPVFVTIIAAIAHEDAANAVAGAGHAKADAIEALAGGDE
jgi:hypothetical protein